MGYFFECKKQEVVKLLDGFKFCKVIASCNGIRETYTYIIELDGIKTEADKMTDIRVDEDSNVVVKFAKGELSDGFLKTIENLEKYCYRKKIKIVFLGWFGVKTKN